MPQGTNLQCNKTARSCHTRRPQQSPLSIKLRSQKCIQILLLGSQICIQMLNSLSVIHTPIDKEMSPHYFFMHTTISNIRLQLAYETNADAAMTNQLTGCGIVQTKKYGRTAQTLTQAPSVLCKSWLKLLLLILNTQKNPVRFPKIWRTSVSSLIHSGPKPQQFQCASLTDQQLEETHSPDY